MRIRWIPALAITYFILMLVAVTYPGYVLFNDIRPFVLGLPFSLFWQVLWICGAVLMLTLLYLWEHPSPPASTRAGEEREPPGDAEGRKGSAAEGER